MIFPSVGHRTFLFSGASPAWSSSFSLMVVNRTKYATNMGSPQPMAITRIRWKPMNFMMGIGTEHLDVTQPVAPLSSYSVQLIIATRIPSENKFCQNRSCEIGGRFIIQAFLCMPECSVPLLGQQINSNLHKLRATLSFALNSSASLMLKPTAINMMLTLTVCWEKEWCLYQLEMPADHDK